MIKHFSEINENQNLDKTKMKLLQEAYEMPEMSKEQLEQLSKKMEEAKMENKKERNKVKMMKVAACAAVFVGAFVALPNTSPTVAKAMEGIPVIGSIASVVTFRDYQYETDRNRADIEVPEIKVGEEKANQKTQEKLTQTTKEINEEINFKAITPNTSFYLNEKGNVVIGFDEGEVAPMYMGTVEFEIPNEVVKDIRK